MTASNTLLLCLTIAALLFAIGCNAPTYEYRSFDYGEAREDLSSELVQQRRLASGRMVAFARIDDMEALIPLLSDSDLIVRIRAREALVAASGVDHGFDQEKWEAARVQLKEVHDKGGSDPDKVGAELVSHTRQILDVRRRHERRQGIWDQGRVYDFLNGPAEDWRGDIIRIGAGAAIYDRDSEPTPITDEELR